MAAAQYEQDGAKPKTVSVLDLAKMLLDGITITDQKQFRIIAHALICMDAALNESKREASLFRRKYEKERARSLERYRSMRKWAKRARLAEATANQYAK